MPRAKGVAHKVRKQDLPPRGPRPNDSRQQSPRGNTQLVAIEDRRARVLALKIEGRSWVDIGKELGVDESTVRSDAMIVTARNITAANDTWLLEREVTRQRADQCIAALMPDAVLGDVKASLAVRMWEETRIKILGLDREFNAGDSKPTEERDQSIVRQLAHPNERLKGLLAEAIKTPGSTLLRVINELVKAMPIETTAESAE